MSSSITTRKAEGEDCQTCGNPAEIVVVTDDGECPLCAEHYELYWNEIPNLLAGAIISALES